MDETPVWGQSSIASQPDTSFPVRINNPKRLGTWSLPAERITIGPGYKPNMAQLKNGELVNHYQSDYVRRRYPRGWIRWRTSAIMKEQVRK